MGLQEDREEYDKSYSEKAKTPEELHNLPGYNIEYISKTFEGHIFCPKCKSLIHASHWSVLEEPEDTYYGEMDMAPGNIEDIDMSYLIACPVCYSTMKLNEFNTRANYLNTEQDILVVENNESDHENPFDTNSFGFDKPFSNSFTPKPFEQHIFGESKPFGEFEPFGTDKPTWGNTVN